MESDIKFCKAISKSQIQMPRVIFFFIEYTDFFFKLSQSSNICIFAICFSFPKNCNDTDDEQKKKHIISIFLNFYNNNNYKVLQKRIKNCNFQPKLHKFSVQFEIDPQHKYSEFGKHWTFSLIYKIFKKKC